jgi:signal transduction histidine kinase
MGMNSLRTRFAIGFSVLFTFFLTIAFLIIYISYADFRKEEFHKRLRDRALTTYRFLVEVDQIDLNLLQLIDKNTLNSLYEEMVLIFENGKVAYSNFDVNRFHFTAALLSKIKDEGEIFTTQDENELVGLYREQNNKQYILLAIAYDQNGIRKMNYLKWVMMIVYFSGLAVVWISTYFFVKRVIRPLDTLKNNLQGITSEHLHTRLKQSGQGEEVDSLAYSFNEMFERLQRSFSLQKDFVHYASHELRTPLTIMVGLTENALNKKLNEAQYREVLRQLFQEQQNLTSITNSLLLLSDKKIINGKEYPQVRLDELLFRSVEIVQNLFPYASIKVNLEGSTSNEESLIVHANEPLLLMAFNNLLKNAVQYSGNNTATVTIRLFEDKKEVDFENAGRPLSPQEISTIFTPFYRASNVGGVKGHGLGLALVKQIATIHNATVICFSDGGVNIFRFCFGPARKDAS